MFKMSLKIKSYTGYPVLYLYSKYMVAEPYLNYINSGETKNYYYNKSITFIF